mmetsp:Transcript_1388/g.2488  ORF Transcript_1388/g.2488 Transcript_1388/m.2488 type:complete len:824 (+) Transcript_1388:140-2611(+)
MSSQGGQSVVSFEDENDKNIDYEDPAFILQNISYKKNFAVHDNFSLPARNNMIECMCDQICFYVMCAYRAHHLAAASTLATLEQRLKIKPPTILVYGSGVVAECALEALKEMGCAPYLKVFSRDVAHAKMWAKKGYRSTVEMIDGYQIDILLICSNLSSFSQLCRDLSQFLTAKTFIISNVFCLQRKRMYHLFGTPGIVRTYVERKGASRPPRDREISLRAFSARQLASKVNGVKNLILILENYMIALDVDKDIARREAIHLVVGSDRVSLDEDRMKTPYKNKKTINFSDEEEESSSCSSDTGVEFDSDTDSACGSVSSFANLAKEVANEVAIEIKRLNSNDFESRHAIFQRRARSFQEGDEEGEKELMIEMTEAEKKFERKQKRKQRRMQKHVMRKQQAKEVARNEKEVTNGEQNESGLENNIKQNDTGGGDMQLLPLDVGCENVNNENDGNINNSDGGSEGHGDIVFQGGGQVSPLPNTPVMSPAKPLGVQSPQKTESGDGKDVNRTGNKSPIPNNRGGVESSGFHGVVEQSPSRGNLMVAFSPKVKSKSNKKVSTQSAMENHIQSKGTGISTLRKSKSTPNALKRQKKEQEEEEEKAEKEKLDKILGITGSQHKSTGYLHEVARALIVNPNPDNIVKKSPLLKIIRNIEKRYGNIFREELSKHILIMDLPSLSHLKQKSPTKRRKQSVIGTVLAQRAALARKKTLLSVMPTVSKRQVGYLNSDELLAIFNSDKKTSCLVDEKSELLQKMDDDSEGEETDGTGDDLFFEDAPREKFRFFVLDKVHGPHSPARSPARLREKRDSSECTDSIVDITSTQELDV